MAAGLLQSHLESVESAAAADVGPGAEATAAQRCCCTDKLQQITTTRDCTTHFVTQTVIQMVQKIPFEKACNRE